MPTVTYGVSNLAVIRRDLQGEMSRVADFDRSTEGMKRLLLRASELCEHFFERAVIGDATETAELFKLYDMILTQCSVLSAMICSAEAVGSHGSAFVDRKPDRHGGVPRDTRTLTRGSASVMEPISPMPDPELWFETLLARKKEEMKHE